METMGIERVTHPTTEDDVHRVDYWCETCQVHYVGESAGVLVESAGSWWSGSVYTYCEGCQEIKCVDDDGLWIQQYEEYVEWIEG